MSVEHPALDIIDKYKKQIKRPLLVKRVLVVVLIYLVFTPFRGVLMPQALDAYIRSKGVNSLYHFTCVQNLPLICQSEGLLSKAWVEACGNWPPPCTGGNQLSHELDRQNDNWDFVSLSYISNTPMFYRRRNELHLCILDIDPSVVNQPKVLFTDSNASKTSGVLRDSGEEGLRNVRFQFLSRNSRAPWDPDWVNYSQAEILIPGIVPFEYIRRFCFSGSASMEYAKFLLRSSNSLDALSPVYAKFFIDPSLFFCGGSGRYVNEYANLIDLKILQNGDSAKDSLFPRTVSKVADGVISAKLYATAGTRSKLSAYDYDTNNLLGSHEEIFQVNDFIEHEVDFTPKENSVLLEYKIGELCWFQGEVHFV